MERYRLSILLSAYNYREGLLKTLTQLSCLDKTVLRHIEVIVGDNSDQPILSTDELDRFRSLDLSIEVLSYGKNIGAVANWNNLFRKAEGRFVWLMHHDESMENPKELIGRVLAESEKEEVGIIIVPIYKQWRIGRMGAVVCQRHTVAASYLRLFCIFTSLFSIINPIGPPSALIIRKKPLRLYDERMQWLVDVEFYSRLFEGSARHGMLSLLKGCKIFSDQDFKGSTTRGLKPSIRRIRLDEMRYWQEKNKSSEMMTTRRLSLVLYLLGKMILLAQGLFTTRIWWSNAAITKDTMFGGRHDGEQ